MGVDPIKLRGAAQRRIRREHTDDSTKTTHFIDGWSEVKDGKLVRYIVHAEKRIAKLASDDDRLEAKSLGVPLFPQQKTDTWQEPRSRRHSLQRFSAFAQGLPSSLIALLILGVLALTAWLQWIPSLRGQAAGGRRRMGAIVALGAALALGACGGHGQSGDETVEAEDDDDRDADEQEDQEEKVVWITELTSADTIFLTDLTDSSLGEADGLGERKTEVALYPYGFARYDDSSETNVYADSPRDRSVGLDHMGARFYAPKLGVWTSADPAILTKPEQYVTAEFAAANPYAYANLRPVVAADRDGQFWHIAAGAAAGALIGAVVEGVRQYASTGKVEDWGRVGAAAGGGAVSGAMTAVNPGVGLATVMGSGAASNAAGGVATRLIESGGKSAGTLTDVAVDATVGAATGGIVKGGSSLLRKVLPKKPVAPPSSKPKVGEVGKASIGTASRPTAVGGVEATLSKLRGKDAEIFAEASRVASAKNGTFMDDLSALSSTVAAKIPKGQVHALGSYEGQPVFGSLVSRTGIVSTPKGTQVVKAPLEGEIEVLGIFKATF